jgi:DNA polymerase-3 subunit delta'
LRFPLLTPAQLETMLARAGVTGDTAAAIKAAEGSFGAAMRFTEQDLAPVATLIQSLLTRGEQGFAARAELARVIGPRADRERLQAVFDLAQAITADCVRSCDDSTSRAALIAAHGELVSLAAQAPTYNFDSALLLLEIGSLLQRASPASEHAHG